MPDATLQELAKSRGVDLNSDRRTGRGIQELDRGSIRFGDQYGSGHILGYTIFIVGMSMCLRRDGECARCMRTLVADM